ncbi:MAG: hypothetical protein CUN55_18270, partial [Phototrophicales bacterium]
INTYGYAYQNPIMYYDPNGEYAVALPGLGIGLLLGLSYCALVPQCANNLASALQQIADNINSQNHDRSIEWPSKPKKGWVCVCRASSSGQQPGNCPENEFAFGTGYGPTYKAARAEAERNARKMLGKQAKHTQCKCVDNKGNRRN